MKSRRLLKLFIDFGAIFFIITFLVACGYMIFVHTMGISFIISSENKLIFFLNILFLSLILTLFDAIRRHFSVEIPKDKVEKSLKKIIAGDYNEKIDKAIVPFGITAFDGIIGDLNKLVDELASVETLKNDFISNVSHEIKTPIAIISNYATLLQGDDLSDEERINYAKEISTTSKNLSTLVTNILKLNKLENQQIFPENKEFNLSENLTESILNYEPIIEEKEINLNLNIQEDVIINGDPQLLSIVWNNLISNALKFTDKNGELSVTLKPYNDEKYIIQIKDNGIGMDQETGNHIFEKFYQGDTSHSHLGNGLGLALVKRIIDITSSDIGVDSKINEGTTFTVLLNK